MKIQIQRETLAEAMRLLGMVIPSRSVKAVLQCVRVVTGDKAVTLHGTNLETSLLYEVSDVIVEEPGEVLIQAHLLNEIAKAGRSEMLVIRSTENGCEIAEVDARYDLYGADPVKFPVPPSNDDEPDAVMPLDELRDGIKRTEFAVARETSRYAIGGVFLKQGKGRAVLVATDGRRLASCQVKDETEMEAKGIVPPKAMKVLAGIAADGKEPVRVKVRERQAWFTCGPVSLTTNLLEGTFPDYEKIIPRNCPVKLKLNTAASLSAIRQAAILKPDDTEMVKLSLSKNRLTFGADRDKLQSACVSVPVEYDGEPIEMGFRPEYVTDALRAIGVEEFGLELTSPNDPGLIRGDRDFLYVFMPMNLS